jgi:hypothetical protein
VTSDEFENEKAAIAALLPRRPYMLADLISAATELSADMTIDALLGARATASHVAWRRRVWFLATSELQMSTDQVAALMSRDGSTVRYGLKKYAAETDFDALDELQGLARRHHAQRNQGLRLCV